MSGALLVQQQRDGILEVILDRPERRNALSRDLLRALHRTFTHLSPDVRVVMLAASGPVFTAGADFADLTGTARDVEYDRDLSAACRSIRECPVPVLAKVDGGCLGAGVELVTSCDARIVGSDAWFRVPALELGLLYNPEAVRRLYRQLPRTTLTRLFVLADRIDADDALASGLATHAVPGQTDEIGLQIATRLADAAPEAMAATRALLGDLDTDAYDPDEWQATRLHILDSADRRTAVAAMARNHLPHLIETTEDRS